jgi:TFIIF-interacting CTD phosphatase-like protein
MPNFDEEQINSLLNALSLSEDLTDVNELKKQLQVRITKYYSRFYYFIIFFLL